MGGEGLLTSCRAWENPLRARATGEGKRRRAAHIEGKREGKRWEEACTPHAGPGRALWQVSGFRTVAVV